MIYILISLIIAANVHAADDMLGSLFARMILAELMKQNGQQSKTELAPQEKQFLKDVKKGRCDEVANYLTEHNNEIPAGALHFALKKQQQEVADLLLERGAYVDEKYEGCYPLHVAAEHCPAYVERLIVRGACVESINQQVGATPLHIASTCGYDDVCTLLIQQAKELVYARDYNNFIPLHCAVLQKNIAIVHQLIKAGSDINAQSNKGLTPLILAACQLRRDNVLQLIDSGALINLQDGDGDTVLHCVAKNEGWDDVVAKLLDRNAQVNATNKKKQTPLHGAAKKNNASIATLLMNKGADVWAQDSDGDIPLLVARDDQTKQVLRNAMRPQQ